MSNGSRLCQLKSRIKSKSGSPELTHRNIRSSSKFQISYRSHIIRFYRKFQSMFMSIFSLIYPIWFSNISSCIVLRKSHKNLSVNSRLPTIKACISRIKRLRIIFSSLFEFFTKLRCPVLRSHLPTIKMKHSQTSIRRLRCSFWKPA